jgi:hypothetical protein
MLKHLALLSTVTIATPLFLVACDGKDDGLTVFTAPPSVTLANPADGSELDEGVPVQFLGQVRDDKFEDSLSSMTVYWSVDGATVCEGAVVTDGGDVTCDHTFNSDGEATVNLTVTNPDGETATATSHVTVIQNNAPTITISSPDSMGTYYSDQIISFEASASDSEDSPESLTVTWESSTDGTLADLPTAPTSDGNVSGATYLNPGEHYIVATVTDSTGRTGSDTVTITVGAENNLPDCSIESPASGSAYSSGDTINFLALASDADIDNSELSASWESDKDGPLGDSNVPNDGEVNFAVSDLSSGTHTISFVVTDEVGGECTDTIIVQVGDEPYVEIVQPETNDVYNEGESVIFLANVSDANDDAIDLEFSWTSDLDGEISTQGAGSGGEASFATSNLTAGTHTVTVLVTDPLGFTGRDTVTFAINGLPSAPTVSISPDPADTSDSLQAIIDLDGEDPEGDDVSYTYAWKQNGASTAYTSSLVPASATTRGDTWQVTVTASDPYGEGDAGTASITIGNSTPTLADVTLSPDPADVEDTLTCTPGAASDADGDTITYTYAWQLNGATLAATGTTLSGVFESGDSVTCYVTPSDSYSTGTAVASNTVVIDNSAPVLEDVTLTPGTPYEDDTLTCTPGVATDEDGDAISYSYRWYVNSLSVAGETSSTLTGTAFNRDDTVFCRVTPSDGVSDGDYVDSNTVTILNTAPTVDSATLTPDPGYTATNLNCTPGSYYDLDGDSVSAVYSWSVDGSTVVGASGATLLSTNFVRDETVTCYVTPTDGTASGTAVASNTVTIINTPPELASVSLSPSAPTSEDTITAVPTGWSDDDGDAQGYQYAWYVNSALVSGSTDSTLSPSNFEVGDTIYVVVTPDDGEDTGDSVTSSTITVGNSAPVVESVTISPTTAYETSTLTCSVDSAYDTDGDSISYTYAWNVSGGTVGVTSNTLDGTYFDKGDTVYCSVTGSDGSDSGDPTTSNTVTISNSRPSVSGVSLSPNPAYTNSTLSCGYSSTSDSDPGDSVTVSYSWEVSGSNPGVTSSSLSSSNFSKGDTVVCGATPNDGDDAGTTVYSSGLTISNTAPSGTSVSITPSSAYTTNDLTANPTGWSDIDGDSAGWLFTWYVNGSSAGSSETLSSSAFEKGDSIYVVAVPWDGTDSGTALTSSTITILNSAPTAPSLSISPSSPEPDDNLSCNIATASTDADSDSISYTYSWYLDGASAGISSSTVSSSYTAHGDTWTCYVYASDGTTSSSTVSASVNVNDGTAPDAPVVGTPARYSNEDGITYSGTCEASASLTYYFSDDDGSWTESGTCSGSGSFSISEDLTRGNTTEMYVTATDVGGNTSGPSNVVTTEVCATVDVYDWSDGGYSSGYGDTEADAIDELSTLVDEYRDTGSLVGNIVNGTDEDWYIVYVDDAGNSGSSDNDVYYENFNFEVYFASGESVYNFYIYEWDGATAYELDTADKVSGGTCDYTGDGFDEFDWYSYDATWSETRACRNSYIYGQCPDYSNTYLIEVVRDSAAADSCQAYELSLSNGIW